MADSTPNNLVIAENNILTTNEAQVANSEEVANELMVSNPPQTTIVNPGTM